MHVCEDRQPLDGRSLAHSGNKDSVLFTWEWGSEAPGSLCILDFPPHPGQGGEFARERHRARGPQQAGIRRPQPVELCSHVWAVWS